VAKNNEENMSIDELRKKYDIGDSKTSVGRLRGACKEYEKIYANVQNGGSGDVDDL
jgi:hypothetical protein